MTEHPYRSKNFEEIDGHFVRKRLPTPEEVHEMKASWLADLEARKVRLEAKLNALTAAPSDGYPADQRAGMLLELLYYFEGQLKARMSDFLKHVNEIGDCVDFPLVEAGLRGNEELPTPAGGKCNDVFDPEALGLPDDFDPESCTLSEWFDYMQRVADYWQSEVLILIEQIEAL